MQILTTPRDFNFLSTESVRRVSFSFTLSHQPLFLNPRETGVSVLPLAWPSAQSWTVSRAQRCRDLGGGRAVQKPLKPPEGASL